MYYSNIRIYYTWKIMDFEGGADRKDRGIGIKCEDYNVRPLTPCDHA